MNVNFVKRPALDLYTLLPAVRVHIHLISSIMTRA